MPVKRYCLRFAMTCSFRRGATGGCEQTEQVFQFSIGLSNNTRTYTAHGDPDERDMNSKLIENTLGALEYTGENTRH